MARKEAKKPELFGQELDLEPAGQAAEIGRETPKLFEAETPKVDTPKKSSVWDGLTIEDLSVDAEMVSGAELGATDTVALGRPHKTQGFRVSTNPVWSRVWYVLEPDREGQGKVVGDGQTYLATPTAAAQIEGLAAGTLTPRRFVLWQNHFGKIGIWSQGVSGGNGATNEWVTSGRRAAVAAVSQWVRVQSDNTAKKYRVFSFPSRTDNPTWPDWTADPQEVLRRSFGDDRLITDLSHPALAELLGGEI